MVIDIMILLAIIGLIVIYIRNQPKFIVIKVDENSNDGDMGIVIEYKAHNKIDLFYYIPQHKVALCYSNVTGENTHKIDKYAKKLSSMAEGYIEEMECINKTNLYDKTRAQVRNDIKNNKWE